MALETKNYEGEYGNRSHITRVQTGTVPTSAVANLMGARGEVPGEHRNRLDDRWDEFKSDIHQNGIREPIFITVDPGESPVISEGNHRRDAAVELGLHEIPAEIRYYGHSERDQPHFASVGWRTAMAVDPAWLQKYMEKNGPYGWHVTHPGNLESIEREGIKYDPDRLDTGIGGNIPDRNYLFTGDRVHSAPFRVDLRKLDPNLFGIDEDAVHLHPGWEPVDSNDRDRLPEFLQQHPELDSPEYVQKSMETDPHSVAYMGDIPPEAIERNPDWWANEKNQRAIQEHSKWQESLQDVVRQHEEQQKFLGTGGIVGRHGEHGWDADGTVYKIIPPDAKYPHGLHIEQRPAPEEVYDAMQASGVEPSWMREWKTKFPELFKAGATGADHAGAMVAIYPPSEIAQKIAVENGEAPEQLHITLAYFQAKAADHTPQEWDEAGEIVAQVAKDHGPIDVKIGGVAQFDSPEGKPTPVVGTVDAPGLAELHVALKDALGQAGFPLNEEHGFNPHLTYTYLEGDEEAPEIEGNAEWTADQIVLVVGGDKQPYNLGGADASNMLPKAAGSDPQRFIAWLNRVALTASTKYSAVPYEDSVKAVQSVLTPDLLHKKYRDNPRAHCYIASEALYHMLGGPAAGLTPMNIVHEGSQHWFLRGPNGEIIDPTHGQFENPVPYENARGRGFLTAQPSKRAAEIIRRVQERKAWYVSDQEKGTHVPVVIIPGTGYVMGNPGDDHRPLEEQLLQAGYRQGDWTQARVNSGVLPDGPYHEVVPNTIDPELQERIKAEAAERLRTHDFRTSAEQAYYYHMAPTNERQRIQTHGIQPANPLYGEGWSQLRGPRGGTPSWFKKQPTGVYVFGNPRDAEDSRTWFGSDDGYNLRKMDMWRIPREAVQQIDQDKHVWKNENKEAYVIPHAVPAEMHLPYEQSSAADTYLDKVDRALGNKPQYDWLPAYPTTEQEMKQMGIGFPDRVIGKTAFDEAQHPRGYGGKWVAKHDQHEVKVHDTKGKHKSTIKRCRHCGSLYERKTDHKGRIGCPTCGLDPERHLHITKVAAATDPVDAVAQSLGWAPARTTANGHTMYGWTDDLGNPHLVTAAHHHIPERQARYARTQMTACMNGACAHPKVNIGAPLMDEPGAPVLRAGQEVQYGGGHWWIMDIDGELAHIYDEKGAEDIVPTRQLRAAGWHFADEDLAERVRDFNEGDHPDTDPDYVFVYYQGKLEMQPYPASYKVMADELLKSYGYDVLNYDNKFDTGVDPDWVTGEVWNGREVEFSIKQLSDPENVEAAEAAVKEVLRGKTAGWVTVADLG